MSLSKIPALAITAVGIHTIFTPPQPKARESDSPKELGAFEQVFSQVVRLYSGTSKVLLCSGSIIEAVAILASQYPTHSVSQAVLGLLVPGSASIASGIGFSTLFVIGCSTVALGSYIRYRCYRTLDRFFTYEVNITKNQQLITHGPYAYVRHPSYSSGFVVLIGAGLCHGSAGSWLRECQIVDSIWGKAAVAAYAAVAMLLAAVLATPALVITMNNISMPKAANARSFTPEVISQRGYTSKQTQTLGSKFLSKCAKMVMDAISRSPLRRPWATSAHSWRHDASYWLINHRSLCDSDFKVQTFMFDTQAIPVILNEDGSSDFQCSRFYVLGLHRDPRLTLTSTHTPRSNLSSERIKHSTLFQPRGRTSQADTHPDARCNDACVARVAHVCVRSGRVQVRDSICNGWKPPSVAMLQPTRNIGENPILPVLSSGWGTKASRIFCESGLGTCGGWHFGLWWGLGNVDPYRACSQEGDLDLTPFQAELLAYTRLQRDEERRPLRQEMTEGSHITGEGSNTGIGSTKRYSMPAVNPRGHIDSIVITLEVNFDAGSTTSILLLSEVEESADVADANEAHQDGPPPNTIPALPIELCERIIDFLWRNTATLKACSLVCKNWHLRSRYHLVVYTDLDGQKQVARFAKWVRSNPVSACIVRRVRLRGDPGHTHTRVLMQHIGPFAPMLAGKLTRLDDFWIMAAVWMPGLMHYNTFLFFSAFTSVTRLGLIEVTFPTVLTFGRLVCSLPNLVHLRCRSLKFMTPTFDAEKFHVPHTKLTVLTTDGGGLTAIIDFLTTTRVASTLRNISLGSDETVCASEAEAIAIVRLLECAGVVLQTVALRLEPDLDTVPGSSTSPLWLLKGVANINPLHTLQRALLQNVSLKEILLSAPLGSQKPNCAWLLSIISGIRSVDVDSISIWLDFQPAHDAEDIQGPLEYFFDPITCASLDEHLTAEKFKGLHDMNFQLRLRPALSDGKFETGHFAFFCQGIRSI
ncbi:hypothetical protein POSPLADRAFT_1158987 [Postia placenta MAD-698-R-SB12]|uniref:Protein-S-isoprenylcysteine O-methyltransferase n=1 Tax=Postia placenta MAD-698-R-SB12 TaxID=670580 RepID=A0A1X6MK69_9APHY|nr:hypothetical protein POSPLADRAFT_1158987 [Postia placenta MAD-698-R-SB12]OSX56827.1 hypothetical protein POSPLADRAFT_1158987 [Postia placenta MAD-698-R-SB12]